MKRNVLDKGYVELTGTMISESDDPTCAQTLDQMVVEAARVSYGQGLKGEEQDKKLLRYLIEHEHGTPFESPTFKFEVKCPIYVQRQWRTHRWGSFNEISGRYTENISDDFYVPKVFRGQDMKNKQGSLDNVDLSNNKVDVNIPSVIKHTENVKQFYINSLMTQQYEYDKLINVGVAKEVARGVLGTAFYTQFVWIVNSRSLSNFIILRCEEHAQWEIRQYAKILSQIFQEKMPQTHEILKKIYPYI